MKFCGQCGHPLNVSCGQCGFANPANFRFCGQCGHALEPLAGRPSGLPDGSAITEIVPAPGLVGGPAEAERRQLTVLFCDLVGSTALSQRLDPEELHQVVGAYQAMGVAVVNRFEGHVAQYLGDGLLVYFGYPLAHEDDAQRAVRSGLGILEAIERLSARLEQEMELKLAVRLGIHTGRVVVGQVGSGQRHEQLALGDTPNIAARLQGLAEPNTIVISQATHRLIHGFFVTEPLGQKELSGLASPIELYQVRHERGLRSRLEAAVAIGLTPLVGRAQELGLLLARWEQVKEGAGQVVSLNGEGGIGKSRLLHSLKERLAGEPHTWLECHGSPYYESSAFYPLTELLAQILQFERGDSAQQKLGKIEAALTRRGSRLTDELSTAVPLLANLLSVPLDDDYLPVNLPPHRRKQLTLEILLAMLLDLSTEQPLLFIIEDLHWVDPSTLEFINLLIEQGSAARILALFSFRPTFSPTWAARSHLTHLTLSRLTRPQITELIERVAGPHHLSPALLQQVIDRTDGVPLFIEELTKMVLEAAADDGSPAGPNREPAIPPTLQDLLMARLDRLGAEPQGGQAGPDRDVAQLAATLGREFSYELLQAVSRLEDAPLRRSLARLVEVELIYQRGLPPQALYIFKHALIQEAAYRTLLRSKRQQYHLTIAQTLTQKFPDLVERQPELLAHHYTAAGLNKEAIVYWQRAGQRASERSANLEAINHLSKGLELLQTLPDNPERTQKQLDLQIALGTPYLMTKGYAALEVERVYAQAWQLCQQIGQASQQASALFGLWVFYLVRADYGMADHLGEQLMAAAKKSRRHGLLMEAHQVQGINLFYRGELTGARAHLTQAVEMFNPQQQGLQLAYSGTNPGVASLCHLALTLWLLGYPAQAEQRISTALSLADSLNLPYSRVFALAFAAWLHQYRQEGAAAVERAEAAFAAATEHAFELLLPFSLIFKGWGLAAQGEATAGLSLLRQGLEAYLATGAELGRLHFMALLAETQGRLGQVEAGLSLLAEAVSVANENGERFYEAELYRLTGELLRRHEPPQPAEAESWFERALAVARQQQAKALELRAATSLARLWLDQGKASESRHLLTDLIAWFSEGFDTPDLKTAQALLDAAA